ncbi:MAG: carboxymuconolactone decarboxylase family protein [Pseudomonadota bacterium]
MRKTSRHPQISRLSEIFAAFPDPFLRVSTLGQRVMRSPESPLSEAERALVSVYVARLNACATCSAHYSGILRSFGLSSDDLDELAAEPHSVNLAPRLRPILALAKSLTKEPGIDIAPLADGVLAVGWDYRAVVFTVAVTRYVNMVTRLTAGLGPITTAPAPTPFRATGLQPSA